jgi:hypothetical protein
LRFELLVAYPQSTGQDEEFEPALISRHHTRASRPVFNADFLVAVVKQDGCRSRTSSWLDLATFAGSANHLHVVAFSKLPEAHKNGAALA